MDLMNSTDWIFNRSVWNRISRYDKFTCVMFLFHCILKSVMPDTHLTQNLIKRNNLQRSNFSILASNTTEVLDKTFTELIHVLILSHDLKQITLGQSSHVNTGHKMSSPVLSSHIFEVSQKVSSEAYTDVIIRYILQYTELWFNIICWKM